MEHSNPHPPRRFLTALSLRRTLTAAHTLAPPQLRSGRRAPGLPRPLLVLGSAIALIAATTTLWALGPRLPWWALITLTPLAAAAAFVAGTIAMTPFLVSMTRSGQGSPTGQQWISPTALTFAACALPLLSPAAPWWNTLGYWTLLGTSMLVSAYLALPALGRDIELDRARQTWDTDPN